MKLHLGCGKKYLKGYKHIDYSNYDHINWVKPIYPLDFIDNNSVNEIYSSHALEYFDFENVGKVLIDWKRSLKKGGVLRLSVPDFDKLLKVYSLNNNNIEKIIGPLFGRWEVSKKEVIYHRCVFNKKKLNKILIDCGFSDIREWDPFEIFGSNVDDYDDYSKAVFPHMDFKNGFTISINLMATKY